jgi:hypothetical protein
MSEKKKKPRMTPKISKEIKEIRATLYKAKAVMEKIAKDTERARELITLGYPIEGYDVVPTKGNRAWIDNMTAEKVFTKFKKFIVDKTNLFPEQEMKSPSQVEKYFVEDEKAMGDFASFTTRAPGKDKLITVEVEQKPKKNKKK